MPDKTTIIIFLYNRLFDPVVQSNLWLYIKDFLNDPSSDVRFHVVSYEDPHVPLTDKQQSLIKEWQSQGLEWTDLNWHAGKNLGFKLVDLSAGFFTLIRLRRQGARHIIAMAAIAGCFAYVCALVLRMRLLIYSYEPHSDVSVASGAWSDGSPQARLTRFFEKQSAEFAHVIVSGTRFMRKRLKDQWKVRAEFFQIPTVVDEVKFSFDSTVAQHARAELGIEPDQPVLFYSGKFGGLYYDKEIPRAYSWLREYEPNLHLLLVTPNDNKYVHELFDAAGIDRAHYSVCHSNYEEIEKYYFVGDMGLITIPPGPGQEFRSSIKVGEYLCVGMPFLTPTGVSEDYVHATEQDVGVVVENFNKVTICGAWPEIKRYLDENHEERRARCRAFGIEYRGFVSLNPVFKQAVRALTNV